MRYKDDNKSETIFHAAIQLINESGFAQTSMSKIAKKANLSPSTIYVYFENKEDMLNKLYVTVKKEMSERLLRNIDESTPVKSGLESILRSLVTLTQNNRDYFLFIEQFENSPLIHKISREEGMDLFKPMFDLFERGKQQKILKQVDTNLLAIHSYSPMMQYVKEHLNGYAELNEAAVERIIEMSWDAIKK